jgi:FAD/FMN-containing dehydrogenase
VVTVRLVYLGTAEEGERFFRPVLEAADPIMSSLAVLPYTQSGSVHGDPTEPGHGQNSTAMLRDLDADAIDTIIGVTGPHAAGQYGVELRHLGGALARPAASPSAVGHFPDAVFNLFVVSMVPPDVDPQDVAAAQTTVTEALAPWAVDSLSLNFLSGLYATPDRIRAAYSAGNYDRLRSLKSQYDPHNTFPNNLNIAPD